MGPVSFIKEDLGYPPWAIAFDPVRYSILLKEHSFMVADSANVPQSCGHIYMLEAAVVLGRSSCASNYCVHH